MDTSVSDLLRLAAAVLGANSRAAADGNPLRCVADMWASQQGFIFQGMEGAHYGPGHCLGTMPLGFFYINKNDLLRRSAKDLWKGHGAEPNVHGGSGRRHDTGSLVVSKEGIVGQFSSSLHAFPATDSAIVCSTNGNTRGSASDAASRLLTQAMFMIHPAASYRWRAGTRG